MTMVERTAPPAGRRHAVIIFGFAALMACLGVSPAHAQMVMQIQPSAAAPGGTGAFDVDLSDVGGTFQVGGFSVEVSVPGGSGVAFTGADTNTTLPYIFGTLQAPPFTFNTFPNTDTTVSDTDFTAPGYVTMTNGMVYALGHFTYSVAPSTPTGPVTVTLVPAGSSLSDGNGDAISFSEVNGTIAVAPIPEPGTLILCGLAGVAGCTIRRRSRLTRRS
jgi:hypothetical protein